MFDSADMTELCMSVLADVLAMPLTENISLLVRLLSAQALNSFHNACCATAGATSFEAVLEKVEAYTILQNGGMKISGPTWRFRPHVVYPHGVHQT